MKSARQDGRVTAPLLDPAGIARLREALTGAGYTSTGIADRIGPAAVAALRRQDLRPTLRALEGDATPLAVLVRLYVCGQVEPSAAVAAALAPATAARRPGRRAGRTGRRRTARRRRA